VSEAAGLDWAEAAAEAERAGDLARLASIHHTWAGALYELGRNAEAKARYRQSAEIEARAGRPRPYVLASELERLRIDVLEGGAEAALAAVEERIAALRSLASEDEMRARVLVGALDVARQARLALRDFDRCLHCIDEMERLLRDLGEPDHVQARTRLDRTGPLLALGAVEDAEEIAMECLAILRAAEDWPHVARALAALAHIAGSRGLVDRAVAEMGRALDFERGLSEPADRAAAHHNLSVFLHRDSRTADSAAHWLAGIAYRVAAGLDPRPALKGLRAHRTFARRTGSFICMAEGGDFERGFTLPRLADILKQPAFDALRRFLEARAVRVDELQAKIDELVATVPSGRPPRSPPPAAALALPPNPRGPRPPVLEGEVIDLPPKRKSR